MTYLDYINGWDAGVLQRAVDNCHCNPFGDVSCDHFFSLSEYLTWFFKTDKQASCCAAQKIFDLNQGQQCHITKSIDEQSNKFFSF